MELPKKQQPPKNIWHNEFMIDQWLEDVFDNPHERTDMLEFDMNEVE